jgi:hypothetical protein
MKTEIDICGQTLLVEYEFKITSRGHKGTRPSFDDPGSPPEAAEFEIDVHGVHFPADVELELPRWLKDVLITHLMESDDVNRIVQDADRDPFYGRDPDYERDLLAEINSSQDYESHEDDF